MVFAKVDTLYIIEQCSQKTVNYHEDEQGRDKYLDTIELARGEVIPEPPRLILLAFICLSLVRNSGSDLVSAHSLYVTPVSRQNVDHVKKVVYYSLEYFCCSVHTLGNYPRVMITCVNARVRVCDIAARSCCLNLFFFFQL